MNFTNISIIPIFEMKKLLMTIGAIALSGMGMAQQTSDKVAYLFTYFTGNAPEQEQICYALSDEGYNNTCRLH